MTPIVLPSTMLMLGLVVFVVLRWDRQSSKREHALQAIQQQEYEVALREFMGVAQELALLAGVPSDTAGEVTARMPPAYDMLETAGLVPARVPLAEEAGRWAAVLDVTVEGTPAGVVAGRTALALRSLVRAHEAFNDEVAIHFHGGRMEIRFTPWPTRNKERSQQVWVAPEREMVRAMETARAAGLRVLETGKAAVVTLEPLRLNEAEPEQAPGPLPPASA
ncbi:MAG: hypothetical protein AAGH15_00920 [Myxococcota bacterium]